MMMRTMRAMAKWIMVLVALAFVGWMVFDVGMNLSGQSLGSNPEVLRVNGRRVTLQEYNQRIREAQEQQRLAGGAPIVTLEDQRALEEAVFERIVQETLLAQEYRRHGITVTDAEVRHALLNFAPQEIREIPQFQTEGQFDLQKYQSYLRSGADPAFVLAIETRYREELPRLKLFERLTEDVYVSDVKLWRTYRDENETVTARVLVLFPQAVVPEGDASVTAEDVERHYREHRAEFERPARAFLSFVAVPRTPDAADSAAAFERARQIRQEIVSGADFAAVAQRESADSASAVDGGDLGEVGRGDFVPAFEEAALALRPGQLSQPVLTRFGYHVIRLESKKGDAYHARHILIPIEPVGQHRERIDTRADTLDLLAAEQSDPSVLDTVAAQLGLPLGQAAPLTEGERVQLGRHVVPDAGLWAFTARPGETSPVIEAEEAYYVFRLDSLQPTGVPPLAAMRDEVARAAMLRKQWDRTRQIARQIAEAVRGGRSLEHAAGEHGLQTRELGPFTRVQPSPVLRDAPAVVGQAFGLPVGSVGGPIETDLAVFFVQPISRQAADRTAFEQQKDQRRAQLMQQARQARVQLILASLREQAAVVDNRQAVERAAREAAERGPIPGLPAF